MLTLHVKQAGTGALMPLDATAGGNLVFSGNSLVGDGATTLDVSGAGSNADVDALHDTISIAGSPRNGMTGFDNLVLANGDTFAAPTGDTVVTVAADPDTIVLTPGHGTLGLYDTTDDNTLLDFAGYGTALDSLPQLEADVTHDGHGNTRIAVPGDGLITLYQDDWTPSASNVDFNGPSVACYCHGTLIATDHGDVPVESLVIGDLLLTASGAIRPIKWIGTRSYAGRFANANPHILPICFKSGSLGDGVPCSDLWVSPKHAMFLDGVLIPAEHLINGVSILPAESVERVDDVHIELDSHDVIIAEGALSETFVDDDSRAMFHNAPRFAALYPEAEPVEAIYCAPRVEDGFVLDAVRRRLAKRAGLSGARGQVHGALRGALDQIESGVLRGWAQNEANPSAPVCLDVRVGDVVVTTVLAERFRPDLAAAGIGNGAHAFEVLLPSDIAATSPGHVVVCRSSDGVRLTMQTGGLIAPRQAA